MATITATTPSSTSSTHYYTFTVPNFKEFTGVSVNTGRVSVESIEGNVIRVKCSGGSYYSKVYGGGSYTPSHTRTETQSGPNMVYNEWWVCYNGRWALDWKYNYAAWNEVRNYGPDSQGYEGVLRAKTTEVSNTLFDPSLPSTCTPGQTISGGSQVWSVVFTGSVTRPAEDTTWHYYYYRYNITLHYEERGVEMTLKVNNQLKKADEVWVMIDGELKTIDNLQMKIDGKLKEGV